MENGSGEISRRSFLAKSTAAGVATAAFTIIRPESVRGAGNEKLKAGLIGCGGRGTEAAQQFLHGNENVELVAMGDIFEDHLEKSLGEIRDSKYTGVADKVRVDPDHHFIGFDAYKKVLASDIDVVLLATPPGYRPEHFVAAVEAKKHIFAEKPFGTDPVGVRKVMAASRKAEELKLTVMSGAQRRHQDGYVETRNKVRDGAIGDIVSAYGYWVGTPVIQQKERDPKWSDMVFQHRAWYSFVWLCGDQIVEQHLHNIDAINWFMGAHPVKVFASGGAAWRPRTELYGNIYDHIDADFTYANGVHMSSHCRQFRKPTYTNVSELIVGTRGRTNCKDMGSTGGEDPYVQEHIALVKSIRGQGPYINDGMAVAESTMTCIMARESAYSGQEITWDEMMASPLDLQPKAFDYDIKLDVPPLPVPGEYKFA
ncbi:MAG TPA: Gfo/Idh/MocA family oxidoreductase [Bryobacteraceae bacterium]|nr:Gfo/Idh/MocA family oxidoreductase [Bryobacteraceae bacterium]